ncbi:unnamed protein product [Amoebophrya sp. A120]|nr:unnamed protein product [Amoebophrya sp. A120]|eukprot:GSA120T00024848001.1
MSRNVSKSGLAIRKFKDKKISRICDACIQRVAAIFIFVVFDEHEARFSLSCAYFTKDAAISLAKLLLMYAPVPSSRTSGVSTPPRRKYQQYKFLEPDIFVFDIEDAALRSAVQTYLQS